MSAPIARRGGRAPQPAFLRKGDDWPWSGSRPPAPDAAPTEGRDRGAPAWARRSRGDRGKLPAGEKDGPDEARSGVADHCASAGSWKTPHRSSSSKEFGPVYSCGRVLASAPMRRLSLLLGGLLFCSSALSAQAPWADWRTIETAHFRVHFPAAFEAWAARAASAMEGIHERVTNFVGYRPNRPIEVLVEDPAAEANGMAYPFLDRPVIVLWTSPPEAEAGLGDYSDWMELV